MHPTQQRCPRPYREATRRNEPQEFSAAARRLRQGVPSRRDTRRVASSRTMDPGGCCLCECRLPRSTPSPLRSVTRLFCPPLSPHQSSTGGKMVSRRLEQGSSTQGSSGSRLLLCPTLSLALDPHLGDGHTPQPDFCSIRVFCPKFVRGGELCVQKTFAAHGRSNSRMRVSLAFSCRQASSTELPRRITF